jgi:hypothetical protein
MLVIYICTWNGQLLQINVGENNLERQATGHGRKINKNRKRNTEN